ncbi:2OG-Fe(II) oxygenase [Prochlorococcus marinus]|uniref:2OG-Fe(II) oxygenase n=1 Tax=Prochlorococcus marinus TaxID=1219 RepID=UPI0022B309FC|nr:2OG-Fe(II) oxygenase [Prochlorococcus marinus]
MTKRVNLEKSKLSPNFIGSWEIESSLCDQIIAYYDKNKEKQIKGATGLGGISLETKDRSDISMSPKDINLKGNEIFNKYFASLYELYKDYNKQWPFLASIVSTLEIGRFNIGKYRPGQHFKRIHTERSNLGTLHRLLAFMTYLNDVEDGGSTYFSHYDLDIKPRKGLTIIWPAEWTHSHKGNIVNTGSKYIITGWLTFPK